MSFLLDTCVISDVFKKIPSVISHFNDVPPSEIHISNVTVMEIEYGLKLNEERERKIRPIWEALLQQIIVLPFCYQCALSTALVRAKLKTLGTMIGAYDCLIAGTALAHQLTMVTSNCHEFKRVSDLEIENWRE